MKRRPRTSLAPNAISCEERADQDAYQRASAAHKRCLAASGHHEENPLLYEVQVPCEVGTNLSKVLVYQYQIIKNAGACDFKRLNE
jgi:hypothetical protein